MSAKNQGRNRQHFNILLFGEALRCPNIRLVNYKFLVYNEDTLRYVYAKLDGIRESYRTVF